MRSTRYFHNNGLATHDGKTWQMCEGYDGERSTYPLRVSIPQEKKPLMFELPTEGEHAFKKPVVSDLRKSRKMKRIDETVIHLYRAGNSVSAIADAYLQPKSRVRAYLEQAGTLL